MYDLVAQQKRVREGMMLAKFLRSTNNVEYLFIAEKKLRDSHLVGTLK